LLIYRDTVSYCFVIDVKLFFGLEALC